MQDALTVDVTSPTAAWLHFLFCTSYHCFYRWSTATIKKKKCVNNCLWLFFKGKCLRPKPRSPPRSLALLNLQGSLEVCLAGFAAEWRVRGCTESCFFHCISAVGDCLYKTHLSHLCDSIHPCKLPAPIHPVSVSIWGKRTVCKRKKEKEGKKKNPCTHEWDQEEAMCKLTWKRKIKWSIPPGVWQQWTLGCIWWV